MKQAIRLLLAAVLISVCAAALFAQGGPGGGPGGPGGPGPGWQGRGPGGGPGPGWQGRGKGFGHRLNLTDEQRKKAQEIFQAAGKQQAELRDQLVKQRQAFAGAKPGTDAEIDKRAGERAQLMAKMQATREKAFANFYNNVLTAEQRTQLDKQREARKNFAGGPGKMGRHGRMGRGPMGCPMMGHPPMGGPGMKGGPGDGPAPRQ